jgi:flagellar secretion chaperone FliS
MSQFTNEYLKTKVLTASPEMLTLMLWDGAIRFAEQGREAIHKKDIEGSYHALLRAQKIVMELTGSLRHDVNPDLCKNLSALYTFIYRRMVDANLQRDAKLVDDALEIMRHQRETWVLVIEKLTQEKAATAQENQAAASATAELPAVPVAAVAASVKPAAAAPVRRAYPAFAVRPVAAPAGLSVQG